MKRILFVALLAGFVTLAYADAPPVQVNAVTAAAGQPERLKSTDGALHVYSAAGATGTGATQVQGTVNDNAADTAANPVEIGGTDGTNIQTLSVNTNGELGINVTRVAGTVLSAPDTSLNDAESNAGTRLNINSYGMAHNGTTWDKLRGDTTGLYVHSPKPATIDTSFTAQAADFTVEAATGSLRMTGWTIRESAAGAAAATVVIRHDADGTCDAALVIAFIELSANQSLQQEYGEGGKAVASGVCVDVLAGEVDFGASFKVEANL